MDLDPIDPIDPIDLEDLLAEQPEDISPWRYLFWFIWMWV